ncbi:MAG: TolB family protein, partial [Bacteroidales bacterium]
MADRTIGRITDMAEKKAVFIILLWVMFFLAGCKGVISDNMIKTATAPQIEPDYNGVTIPPNIASMNFMVREKGNRFLAVAESGNGEYRIKIRSCNGKICFHSGAWRKLTEKSKGDRIIIRIYSSEGKGETVTEYEPLYFYVAPEPVDPYLAYRLIFPGYYCWSDMRIVQRCVEDFSESSIIENQVLDMNCINCHSFSSNRADRFLIHVRGSKGGTYVVTDANITRRDLKIDPMPGSATYPSWHPSSRYIAFSSNQVRQTFYAHHSKCIEVFDLVSDIIIYDLEKNNIIMVKDKDTTKYLETFPGWSPDGKYLYFCRALHNVSEPWRGPEKMELVKYSLVRVPFDPETGLYGAVEMVYDAASEGKSVSFPRISPDGKYLVLTMADYGTFPNWHREADLYIINLQNGEAKKMDINSNETESWHEWSSNGKWIIFSSKRLDGRSTR